MRPEKFVRRNKNGGQKEGQRKWDWQEPWRGWNKQGVTHQGEKERNRGRKEREMQRDGKSGREKQTEGEKQRGE